MQIQKSSLFYSIFFSNRFLAVISVVLAILVAFLEIASNALILPLMSILGAVTSGSETIGDGLHLQWLFEKVPAGWQLLAVSLGLLFLNLFKNVTLYGSSLSINAFMLKSGMLLRQRCLERFLELELPFYAHVGTGKLLGYVNDQAQRSEKLFSVVLELTRETLFIAFLAIFLIVLSPVLTLIASVSLISVACLLKIIIQGVQKHGRRTAHDLEAFSSLVSEILSGIRVIKVFSSEDKELMRAKDSLRRRYISELAAYKFNSAVAPFTEVAGISVLLVIILAGNYFLESSHEATLAILMTYTLTLLRTLPRVNHLNGLRAQLSLLQGSFESIECFIKETDDQSLAEGKDTYRSFQSKIDFSQLTFTYPGNSVPALSNLNLSIPKGRTIALVGQSGSGKSTLIDLLMRFYDPDHGSIMVDGEDLRKFNRKSWHRAMAVVSQDTFLFNATVRENIAYGVHEASDDEIVEAARKACALEFIESLPNGFETIVGNRGSLLSGGQKQRIAIARAILCDPDILILDEATSALDTRSERVVQKAINKISCDRTVLVIAHRLSTIEGADQIVVMQNGKVLEHGDHAQLMSLGGAYYSLHRLQSSAESQVPEAQVPIVH